MRKLNVWNPGAKTLPNVTLKTGKFSWALASKAMEPRKGKPVRKMTALQPVLALWNLFAVTYRKQKKPESGRGPSSTPRHLADGTAGPEGQGCAVAP